MSYDPETMARIQRETKLRAQRRKHRARARKIRTALRLTILGAATGAAIGIAILGLFLATAFVYDLTTGQ